MNLSGGGVERHWLDTSVWPKLGRKTMNSVGRFAG